MDKDLLGLKCLLMYRKQGAADHSFLIISGSEEEASSFLVCTPVYFIWSINSSSTVKKAQHHLYFKRLRTATLPLPFLTTVYRETVESILPSYNPVGFWNCTIHNYKISHCRVRAAERIIGVSLLFIHYILQACCFCKASAIVKDPPHPSRRLGHLLVS